jgi:cytochrome c oxidase subunit II
MDGERRRGGRLSGLTAAALSAASCRGGVQSALDPAGPQAGHIATLWWVLLGVSIVVWAAVCVALGLALWRRGREPVTDPRDGEPYKVRAVAIGGGLTVVILIGLVTYSVMVGRATSDLPAPHEVAVEVEVIGRQWWWELRYRDPQSNRSFVTANELHLPVGRPVVLRLTAGDVIHSFWVPNLHGKLDLLPGRTNTLWLQADRPGVYRGQCAEFCGLQHAKMALIVVAESDADFAAWADAYRTPVAPADARPLPAGARVFREAQCVLCHSVRSVEAFARVGPDLTRLAARRTLAAGTLPNTPDALRAWISDPQRIKPGTFMPATHLPPEQLEALVEYLGTLR